MGQRTRFRFYSIICTKASYKCSCWCIHQSYSSKFVYVSSEGSGSLMQWVPKSHVLWHILNEKNVDLVSLLLVKPDDQDPQFSKGDIEFWTFSAHIRSKMIYHGFVTLVWLWYMYQTWTLTKIQRNVLTNCAKHQAWTSTEGCKIL